MQAIFFKLIILQFISVQSFSCARLFVTPWTAARQASLSITISQSSLRLMSIDSVMTCSHLIFCHPLSSCPQSLPAQESYPMSQLFTWGGQSTGASALASVLPKKSQGWSPSECTGWISLQSKGLSRVFSNHSSKASILWCSAFLTVQLSHQYMTTGKTRALTRRLWLTRYSTRVKWYLFHTVITADIQDEYYWTKTLNTSPKNAWWVAESEFISDIIHCMILCFIHHVVLRI